MGYEPCGLEYQEVEATDGEPGEGLGWVLLDKLPIGGGDRRMNKNITEAKDQHAVQKAKRRKRKKKIFIESATWWAVRKRSCFRRSSTIETRNTGRAASQSGSSSKACRAAQWAPGASSWDHSSSACAASTCTFGSRPRRRQSALPKPWASLSGPSSESSRAQSPPVPQPRKGAKDGCAKRSDGAAAPSRPPVWVEPSAVLSPSSGRALEGRQWCVVRRAAQRALSQSSTPSCQGRHPSSSSSSSLDSSRRDTRI